MHRRFIFATLLLLLAACGSEAPTVDVTKGGRAQKAVVADIGKLVPQEAMAVLYTSSLNDLANKLKGVVSSIDPEMAAQIDVAKMTEEMPLGKFLDGNKPLAVAVSMSKMGGEPRPTLIMPITDVAKAKEVQGGPERVFSGNYCSMNMGPGTPPEPSAETHRLLKEPVANDLTLRIDVEGLTKLFANEIDGAKKKIAEGANEMGEAGEMFQGIADKAMAFVDAAEIADIGISMAGSEVDLRFALSMKAGSEFDKPMPKTSGKAAAYAKMLPPGLPLQAVMHIESSFIAEMFTWVVDLMKKAAADQPEAGAMISYMEEMGKLVESVGPNYAMGMGFEDGIVMVSLADAKDPETYLAKMQEVLDKGLTEKMGVKYEKMPGAQAGGVDIHTYKMGLDMEKMSGGNPRAAEQADAMMKLMFGKDGMVMHLAAVKDKIVGCMGSVDKMKEAIQFAQSGGGSLSAGLAKAVKYSGGTPTFAFDVDLRAILKQVMPALADAGAEVPPVPEGGPARIVIYGGRDGRVYRGGLSVDVGEIAGLVKSMEGGR